MGYYLDKAKRVVVEKEMWEELERVISEHAVPPAKLPPDRDPDLPGLSDAERAIRISRLYSGRVIENTATDRLEVLPLGDRWSIEGHAASSGRLRIYVAWLEEYKPAYILVRTERGTFYTHPTTLWKHGRRGQDRRGSFLTLEAGYWKSAEVMEGHEPGGVKRGVNPPLNPRVNPPFFKSAGQGV
ncbi:MAG: hypothetical protein H5T73_11520 [Actinobacteria bacterium]|nr:hypothetical protein [Actinomycetota bacterium]